MTNQDYAAYLVALHNSLMRLETHGESTLQLSDIIRSVREQLQMVSSDQSTSNEN